MKKTMIMFAILLSALLMLQSVSAMSAGEARVEWKDLKRVSQDKKDIHNEAKSDFAIDKSEENRERVVETGKDLLHSALDEAEAWLKWKDLEAEENPEVPSDIKQDIFEDVETNLVKINDLRSDVDAVNNQIELGLTFLKMVGKYFELLADVMRDSGKMWAYIAESHADKIEEFELKLRVSEDPEVQSLLDDARDELQTARENIDRAEQAYAEVKLPGKPLIKFSEGNNYLRSARANMLAAHSSLDQAYREMVR